MTTPTSPTTTAMTTPTAGARRRPVEDIESMLDAVAHQIEQSDDPSDRVRVRELFKAVGRRAYGPLLLAIGLFSISPITAIPGLTWASAALAAIVAVQMAIGLRYPWMPKSFLNAAAPRKPILAFIDKARPWARAVDRVVRPRLTFLTAPPFVTVIALICLSAALVTIPLGFVPLAPLAPGIAIVLFGLGMTARDGLVLLIASAVVIGAGLLSYELLGKVADLVGHGLHSVGL